MGTERMSGEKEQLTQESIDDAVHLGAVEDAVVALREFGDEVLADRLEPLRIKLSRVYDEVDE